MAVETQTDKFTLVAQEFLNSKAPLRLPVGQNWPEFLKDDDGAWKRMAAEGFNVFELMRVSDDRGYASPFWLTLRDGELAGGKLRPGARGVNAALWRWSKKLGGWEGDITAKNAGIIQDEIEPLEENEKAVGMRPTVVFNAEEWEGIQSWPRFERRTIPSKDEALERAQKVEAQGAGCEIRHEGSIAYYNPTLNYICVPPINQVGPKRYYWMLFEQIAHALASRHQLNVWGDKIEADCSREPSFRVQYAKMTAAILAYETGIDVLE